MLTQKTQTVTARVSYIKWKDEDCFKIGDYALKNGNAATIRKSKQQFPGLKESTVRTFKQKFEKELNNASREKREVNNSIPKYSSPTCDPLLLGELENIAQVHLRAVYSQDAAINTNIAKATAKGLNQRYPDVVGNIDIDSSSWAKSLFKAMGFVKRAKTSAKVSIPDGAREEIEYLLYHEIAAMVDRHCIPHSMA